MALIQCHECSGQVSDHARTCPHCGAPVIATIKRRQKAALIGLAIRIGAALLIGISFLVFWHFTMGKVLAPLQNFQQQAPPH
jgi:sensor c-di-GMP phosphodiesterase-like protein